MTEHDEPSNMAEQLLLIDESRMYNVVALFLLLLRFQWLCLMRLQLAPSSSHHCSTVWMLIDMHPLGLNGRCLPIPTFQQRRSDATNWKEKTNKQMRPLPPQKYKIQMLIFRNSYCLTVNLIRNDFCFNRTISLNLGFSPTDIHTHTHTYCYHNVMTAIRIKMDFLRGHTFDIYITAFLTPP